MSFVINKLATIPEDALGDLNLISYIREGNLEGVKTATSNWGEDDYTRLQANQIYPLHLATCFGHVSLVQHLLEKSQLDINQQNQEGSTALHLAVAQNHAEIVELLLSRENLDVLILDSEHKTPIDRAHNETIKARLLEYLKQQETKTAGEIMKLGRENQFSDIIKKYEEFRVGRLVPINSLDPETGRTLLHWAALGKDEKAIQWLLNQRADVSIKDNEGNLPYDLVTDFKLQTLLLQGSQAEETGGYPRMEGTLKKWTNLASGYKDRYFILEDGKISYFKTREDIDKASRGTIVLKSAQVKWSEGSTNFEVASVGHIKLDLRADHVVEAKKWVDALLSSQKTPISTDSSQNTEVSTINSYRKSGDTLSRQSIASMGTLSSAQAEPKKSTHSRVINSVPLEASNSEPQITAIDVQSDYSIKATLMSIGTHSDVHKRILESCLDSDSGDSVLISKDALKTLMSSIQTQKSLINDAFRIDAQREMLWHDINKRQLEEQSLWRNNLENLAQDHHKLENLIKTRTKLKKFQKAGRAIMAINTLSNASSEATSRQASETDQANAQATGQDTTSDEPEAYISEDEEQFFDADDGIDTTIAESYTIQRKDSKAIANESPDADPIHDVTSSYSGYPLDGKFRDRLEMSGDIIPDVSIWSILKNSVGKDLSKIAVPVEFNEPTSMLQRMCEDMEYSELLDIAVQQPESIDRMLWVAAFAMSNYSSTLGRTGKPFNPLLGETFEYVRPDRGFRYVSEQVSHHPPISACYCESPNYTFQAEVNLVSKFWGKSFELNPQGVTHLFLKLPATNNETRSDTDSTSSHDEIQEHYTWTKVTSAMNNIIIGTMYIEHYGDMIIKNHRTGEECTLTFHQTGWRSSNQHVVRGLVRDANGRDVWEIGGRWDDKLVARRVGLSGGDLVEKLGDNDDQVAKSTASGSRPVLLWKATPSPQPPIAYHLTSFAATLNQMTEDLPHHLPPTDSRHRPDQKAMERGDFKAANDLKVELESKQRQRRKANPDQPHHPRWFTTSTDPDTQSPIWSFDSQYWAERARCGHASLAGEQSVEWDRVTKIFE